MVFRLSGKIACDRARSRCQGRSPAERGRRAATRLDAGEHTVTLVGPTARVVAIRCSTQLGVSVEPTRVRRQLLSAGASRHARSPWAARPPRVPTDPGRRPARATPRSRTRRAIPATPPATPGTVPATPGASAPRRSTAVAAISGLLAGGTGPGIRRLSAAPGNVPAAPRSSAPQDNSTPLRNGAGKRSAERSRDKRGDRPTARLSSASVHTCTFVRDSGAAPRRRPSGQSNAGRHDSPASTCSLLAGRLRLVPLCGL